MLTITTPATDLSLLTLAEMRAAAGVTAGTATYDAALVAMEARCASLIMSECGIAVGAGANPTLRSERVTETFRNVHSLELILARRHNIVIISIVVDGATLDTTEYEVDPESGLVQRLCDDHPIRWCGRKIVVVYTAGFAVVPADLKQAASDFLRSTWLEKSRDPLVKSERTNIPGVQEKEIAYWIGAVPGQSSGGAVPDPIAAQLARFMNAAIG
ncbi:hypothetical protein [Mesorhizobium sp. B2-4-6]|uniref:hypothetical protein n=1 Tax=Mesorhizobium sp. B2-4-6 TaxID=2589943 RepID=UPI00112D91E7|nr:hypothetical protein [Mesorhizobium sp. B2-4-6]TPL40687.1 hypothetical protein FJ957_26005 [Mesorhizobium sp. B2-4-6]